MNKLYAMTDSLKGILQEYSNDIDVSVKIHQALDFYISQYKNLVRDEHNDILGVISSFHLELDNQVEAKKIKVPELAKDIKCKMGCSHCCYYNVDISRHEAALIKNFTIDSKMKIDKSLLMRQVVCTSVKAWGRLDIQEKRCVFLNGMGFCTIYKHRPAACRKLLIITDPELCNLKTINKVGRFVDWHIEVIASAILNGSESGPMPEMLLEELCDS
jgi:Fe-S-cluster containining protein